MNLPLEHPPATWHVTQTNDSVSLERTSQAPVGKNQFVTIVIASLFIISFLTGVRVLSDGENIGAALFSLPVLGVVLLAISLTVVVHRMNGAPGNRLSLVLEPTRLIVHRRFGSKRETLTVERNRILRFVREVEHTVGSNATSSWGLLFIVRGAIGNEDEIVVGVCYDHAEAEWFTKLLERWSGQRVRDEVVAEEADDTEESAYGEDS